MNEPTSQTDRDRPFYDPGTKTHYIALPKGAFSAVDEGLAMLHVGLFGDMVCDGEMVEVVCEDDPSLAPLQLRVANLAAICEKVPPGYRAAERLIR